jgi:hypothetical protein
MNRRPVSDDPKGSGGPRLMALAERPPPPPSARHTHALPPRPRRGRGETAKRRVAAMTECRSASSRSSPRQETRAAVI